MGTSLWASPALLLVTSCRNMVCERDHAARAKSPPCPLSGAVAGSTSPANTCPDPCTVWGGGGGGKTCLHQYALARCAPLWCSHAWGAPALLAGHLLSGVVPHAGGNSSDAPLCDAVMLCISVVRRRCSIGGPVRAPKRFPAVVGVTEALWQSKVIQRAWDRVYRPKCNPFPLLSKAMGRIRGGPGA